MNATKNSPTTNNTKVTALVLRAAGTNCDQETVQALKEAGADSDVIHINQLLLGKVRLHPYQMIVIPGGFSYGDDISAGKVLANELKFRLKDQLKSFIEAKKLVIGVCNGFQVLVKAGLLPGFEPIDAEQSVTLSLNDSGKFQCEWIDLNHEKSAAAWLDGLAPIFELPIAHGEGKFITASSKILATLKKNKQIVFRYKTKNPNGSEEAIAGICNPQGNVIGLMPHPERFLSRYHHPNWTNRPAKNQTEWGDGFWFWKQAVTYAQKAIH